MGGSKAKRDEQSRCQLEPLISTRRQDGLWQSIERDEEDLAWHEEFQQNALVVPKEADTSDLSTAQHLRPHRRDSATAPSKAETSQAATIPDMNSTEKETPAENCSSRPTRADVPAPMFVSPLQRPTLPPPERPHPDTPRNQSPSPQDEPQPAARRRRGRPRKSHNTPNWNRPRRVRFSDPIPPAGGPGPQPEPRDSHVFVRLLKIIVTVDGTHPPQRQELVWNNRSKGWRLAGERSERNIGDVGELFDDAPANGSLRVILAPTLHRGAREPVEVAWDASRCCFQGQSQDGGGLAVALGEMKDMVKDPWARQFTAYGL